MSPAIPVALVSVEVVAPVALVDSLVTPIVLEGDVVEVVLLGVVLSVVAARDGSVEEVLVESGVLVAVLELGVVVDGYVELGLVELEVAPGVRLVGVVSVVGSVAAVVFKLPLVFSLVVLRADRVVP
jgi:hypothetical protein